MSDESWKEFANCKGEPLDDFFDNYEKLNEVQIRIDTLCGNCVVRRQCLEWALSEGLEGGVFGRKFIKKAKVKKKINV